MSASQRASHQASQQYADAVRALVVAKAPVPGRVKTRLAATVGVDHAAALAAASLLDTLTAATQAFGADRCVLALDGDLGEGVGGDRLAAAARGWTVVPQRGEGLGARLAAAHDDAGPGPVLQVGMDTPQASVAVLHEVAADLDRHDAVLGPAEDGGWWVLALRDPGHAAVLADVPMSTRRTSEATLAALRGRGLSVARARTLRDVDTAADADAVAATALGSAFAAAWAPLVGAGR